VIAERLGLLSAADAVGNKSVQHAGLRGATTSGLSPARRA
jgi:hypothetical protein